MRKKMPGNKGFTLIELSVVLVVVALVLGTSLTLGASRAEVERISQTKLKMDTIETAIKQYVTLSGTTVVNGIPCPADPTIDSSDAENYGLAIDNATCKTIDNVNGPIFTSGNAGKDGLRVGAVPTRTLYLDPEYQLDGWGNRFTYGMNYQYNSASNNGNSSGILSGLVTPVPTITIKATSAGTAITDDGAYVLISHGKNGRGAWKRKGGTRVNTGTSSADELENSHCGQGVAGADCPSAYNEIFVARLPSTDYDDITRYKLLWQIVTYNSGIVSANPGCSRPSPSDSQVAEMALDDASNYYTYNCQVGGVYVDPRRCVPLTFNTTNGNAGLSDYDSGVVGTPGTMNIYSHQAEADVGAYNYSCLGPDGGAVLCKSATVLAGSDTFPTNNGAGNGTNDNYVTTPLTTSGNCVWWQF